MKIIIEFSSSWENSFISPLTSNINECRNFVGSSAKGSENYQDIQLTKQTVMGILNRLIGDQRRLSQSIADPNYFFKEIEDKINFIEEKQVTDEIVFLRNINRSKDQNSLSGIKMENFNPLFSGEAGRKLWSILLYNKYEMQDLILNNIEVDKSVDFPTDQFSISEILSKFIDKGKDIFNQKQTVANLQLEKIAKFYANREWANLSRFGDDGAKITYKSLFFSSLYVLLDKMIIKDPSLKSGLTEKGNLQGISKFGFTYKDFLKGMATPKYVVGNPTIYEIWTNIDGKKKKITKNLKKKSGKITIDINVNKETADIIKEKILFAGVNSFVVGKKGLAFVKDII